jgi:hypothetical protein
MRLKRTHVATLDEVAIIVEDDGAVIAYRIGPSVPLTSGSGPEVHRMTDREILDRFNAGIRATEALAGDYQHVAVGSRLPRIAFSSVDRALLAEPVTSPRRSRGCHARRPGGRGLRSGAGWSLDLASEGAPASTWPLPSN